MARTPAQRVTQRTNIRNLRVGGIGELARELDVTYTRASSMVYRYPGNGSPGPLPAEQFPPMSMGRLYDLDQWAEWYRKQYVPEDDENEAPVA